MQTKKVTLAQLTQILLQRHTPAGIAVFAKVLMNTDARLNKRGNPYPNCRKQTEMSVLLNTKYESRVHNQLDREDKPHEMYQKGEATMPLVFGENNKIVGFFNGEPVLACSPYDKSYPVVTYWSEDGFEVPESEIRDFIKEKAKPQNQGTDKPIFWMQPYLKNIVELTLDGTKYEVIKK